MDHKSTLAHRFAITHVRLYERVVRAVRYAITLLSVAGCARTVDFTDVPEDVTHVAIVFPDTPERSSGLLPIDEGITVVWDEEDVLLAGYSDEELAALDDAQLSTTVTLADPCAPRLPNLRWLEVVGDVVLEDPQFTTSWVQERCAENPVGPGCTPCADRCPRIRTSFEAIDTRALEASLGRTDATVSHGTWFGRERLLLGMTGLGVTVTYEDGVVATADDFAPSFIVSDAREVAFAADGPVVRRYAFDGTMFEYARFDRSVRLFDGVERAYAVSGGRVFTLTASSTAAEPVPDMPPNVVLLAERDRDALAVMDAASTVYLWRTSGVERVGQVFTGVEILQFRHAHLEWVGEAVFLTERFRSLVRMWTPDDGPQVLDWAPTEARTTLRLDDAVIVAGQFGNIRRYDTDGTMCIVANGDSTKGESTKSFTSITKTADGRLGFAMTNEVGNAPPEVHRLELD